MNKVLILTNMYNEEVIKKYFNLLLETDIVTNISALSNECNIILNYNDLIYFEKLKKDYNLKIYDMNKGIYRDYKIIKKINPNINIFKYIRYMIHINISILLIDKLQSLIRSNIGFEINKGSFKRIEKSIKSNFHKEKYIFGIFKRYFNYKKRLNNIYLDKPKNCMKVGILSNDYVMDDYTLENILSSENICPNIFIDSYGKRAKLFNKYYMLNIKEYCKYNISNNIIRNIYLAKYMIKNDYDGIIFIKRENNIKDESTSIILSNICNCENISVIDLIIDDNTSDIKIKNTVNALSDMIKINRK